MVVVEVRQGTLSMDGRGWGPAENTVDRGSQLDEEDEDEAGVGSGRQERKAGRQAGRQEAGGNFDKI